MKLTNSKNPLSQILLPAIVTQTLSFTSFVDRVNAEIFFEGETNIASAPESFTPRLRQEIPPPPPQPSPSPEPPEFQQPPLKLESLTTDFRRDLDNFDRLNLFFEPTARFRLPNGDSLSVTTGVNYFNQDKVESIVNVPLRVGWEGKIDETTVGVTGGVDFFDRLPIAPNLRARIEHPIYSNVSPTGRFLSGLTVSGEIEYAPYKFNARTLENEIQTLHFGPSLYWQIDPDMSLFSTFRYGDYSDGNEEFQSFTRLERNIGEFFVAANLFTWSYTEDVQEATGYFSPPDFLVYTGEVGWQAKVTDFLRCRVATSFGQQRLEGNFDFANSYTGSCTAIVSRNFEFDLSYTYSNVFERNTGDSTFNNRAIATQLRFNF